MHERNPLHADYYADQAQFCRAAIVDSVAIARDTYRLRIECPAIARAFVPGQFVMIRLAGTDDPLLGRPLAVYETVLDEGGNPTAIDVVYVTFGRMTRRLARCTPGGEVELWGPLGNGFPPLPTEHLIMVAGGIGQTPFLALGKAYLGLKSYGSPPFDVPQAPRVTLCYGVRTAALLAGVPDFEAAGIEVRVSSDDGSTAHHGFVTDLLGDVLDETRGSDRLVVCCGPEPMMHAVADLCELNETRCLVSLETPMACGIGICFTCVARVRQEDGAWDWKRTCVEGPVFDAAQIEW